MGTLKEREPAVVRVKAELPPPPDLLTVPEAAARLRRSADSLYRMVRSPEGFEPAVKIGSRWLISVPKLERMLHGDAP